MLVSLIFITFLRRKWFGQWKIAKGEPQDISGSHEMELWVSEILLSSIAS
jgi:hypothetical protein